MNLTAMTNLIMGAKTITIQGNMVATIEETNKDTFIKRGDWLLK